MNYQDRRAAFFARKIAGGDSVPPTGLLGGCDDCNAYQMLSSDGPGVYRITIVHDAFCPGYLALRGQTDD